MFSQPGLPLLAGTLPFVAVSLWKKAREAQTGQNNRGDAQDAIPEKIHVTEHRVRGKRIDHGSVTCTVPRRGQDPQPDAHPWGLSRCPHETQNAQTTPVAREGPSATGWWTKLGSMPCGCLPPSRVAALRDGS